MTQEEMEMSWRNVLDCNADIEHGVNNEWKCIICRKVLINAHSVPCGCRYCLRCITDYLYGSDRFCPGNSEDCKDQMININTNVIVDQAINRKISKIVVKCPEQFCNFKDELRKIMNHTRLCSSGTENCPYTHVGCNKFKITKDKVNEHLETENYSHSKLMIEWIDNLRNEMEVIKRDLDSRTCENQRLKEEINEMKAEMREKEVKFLDLECKETENREKIKSLEQTLRQVELDKGKIEMKGEKTIPTAPPIISDSFSKEISPDNGSFDWKIEDLASKRLNAEKDAITEIYSKPFFTHEKGYRICLRADLNGRDSQKNHYMSLYFCLMRGPFDDLLSWPLAYHVILELINQKTGLVHCRNTARCNESSAYSEISKPTVERNNGFGFPRFMKLEELWSNNDLIMNNQLVIRCRTKIP